MQDFSKGQTKSPHRHRVKSVVPRTRMVLRTGIVLVVPVRVRENPTGSLIGLGDEPVDLKFASLNTKVRLKYRCQCFATIPWNVIPVLVGDCGILVCFLVLIVDFLVVIVQF